MSSRAQLGEAIPNLEGDCFVELSSPRSDIDPSIPQCKSHCLSAGVGGRLVKDGVDVELDCPFADAETIGDLFVGETIGGKSQYFVLAWCEGMFDC